MAAAGAQRDRFCRAAGPAIGGWPGGGHFPGMPLPRGTDSPCSRNGLYRPAYRGWIKVKNPGYWRGESELAAITRSVQRRAVAVSRVLDAIVKEHPKGLRHHGTPPLDATLTWPPQR